MKNYNSTNPTSQNTDFSHLPGLESSVEMLDATAGVMLLILLI